jgi:hypothetical protein
MKKLGVLVTPTRFPSSCDGFHASLNLPEVRHWSNLLRSMPACVAKR